MKTPEEILKEKAPGFILFQGKDMVGLKTEFWVKGVDEKVHPDIVIQIKMKEKKQRQQWTDEQKLNAKVWMIEQRNRLNDFITDL